mgnify:FL=1
MKKMKCSECGFRHPEYAFHRSEKKRKYKKCIPCFKLFDN